LLVTKYKEIIGSVDEEIDQANFTNWCKSIGLNDKPKVDAMFLNLDTDVSGKIGF